MKSGILGLTTLQSPQELLCMLPQLRVNSINDGGMYQVIEGV